MGISIFPAAAGGGVTTKVQEFTATGTFTVPSNCSAVQVFLVGGGGGGGGVQRAASSAHAGGGGGGGVVQNRWLTVTPGASITVTIGAGGAGGASVGAPRGLAGSDTTFGSLATAFGGGSGNGLTDTSGGDPGATRATTGGAAIVNENGGGGGGGAAPSITAIAGNVTTPFRTINQNHASIGGVMTGSASHANSDSMPGLGIEGFGGGGQGGTASGSATNFHRVSVCGGGTAGASENSAGNNGTANKGGGGGGGSQTTVGSTYRAGGAGGSGFAIITFYS